MSSITCWGRVAMIAAICSSSSRKLVGAQRSNVSAYSRDGGLTPVADVGDDPVRTRWPTSSCAVSANDLVCAVFSVGGHARAPRVVGSAPTGHWRPGETR